MHVDELASKRGRPQQPPNVSSLRTLAVNVKAGTGDSLSSVKQTESVSNIGAGKNTRSRARIIAADLVQVENTKVKSKKIVKLEPPEEPLALVKGSKRNAQVREESKNEAKEGGKRRAKSVTNPQPQGGAPNVRFAGDSSERRVGKSLKNTEVIEEAFSYEDHLHAKAQEEEQAHATKKTRNKKTTLRNPDTLATVPKDICIVYPNSNMKLLSCQTYLVSHQRQSKEEIDEVVSDCSDDVTFAGDLEFDRIFKTLKARKAYFTKMIKACPDGFDMIVKINRPHHLRAEQVNRERRHEAQLAAVPQQ